MLNTLHASCCIELLAQWATSNSDDFLWQTQKRGRKKANELGRIFPHKSVWAKFNPAWSKRTSTKLSPQRWEWRRWILMSRLSWWCRFQCRKQYTISTWKYLKKKHSFMYLSFIGYILMHIQLVATSISEDLHSAFRYTLIITCAVLLW